MPIGISSGTIRNKKATVRVEDKVKKIVQTYGNLYFLTENGILSGIGLNNSVQISGSDILNRTANFNKVGTTTTTVTGAYIKEWGLGFEACTSCTPNLGYMYFTRGGLNSSNILDFDATFTGSYIFSNTCLMVGKNGGLSGWGFNANNELGINSDSVGTLRLPKNGSSDWETDNPSFPQVRPILKKLQESIQNKLVFKPTTLNNITNWTSVVANNVAEYYKHILLNSNGEIYTFGGDLNPPVKMGSNSDWKYISYDYAINNNNELYRLRDVQYPIIYNTNALIGGGQALGDGNSTLVNPLTFLNYGDKIKKVVASNTSRDVMLLTESGKLSGIGINNLSLLGGIPTNQYKLSAIPNITDNIKDVVISRNSAYAYTNDNSLLVWGTNLNSRLGTGSTAATLTTPTKVLSGLVSEVIPLSSYTLVLGTNGTVSAAGKNETYGILGTGDTANKTSFTKLTGLAGVKQLVGNNTRNYALGTNGLLSGWGMGSGLLGDDPQVIETSATLTRNALGIALDSNGNIYYSGSQKDIFKYDPNTNIISTFRTITSVAGTIAQVSVKGIRIVNDIIYAAVRGPTDNDSRIVKISTDGNTETIMGGTTQSFASINGFCYHRNSSTEILDPSSPDVFIACMEGSSSFKVLKETGSFTRTLGSASVTSCVDDGALISGSGTRATTDTPYDICTNNGRYVYATITGCRSILEIDTQVSPFNGRTVVKNLVAPRGIAINGNTLYFCDRHCIKSVPTAGGTPTIIAGDASTLGFLDGIGTQARFNAPTFLEYNNGFLYVSDGGTNRVIRKVNVATREVTPAIINRTVAYLDRLSAVPIPYVGGVDKIFVSGVGNTVFTLGTNKQVSAWGSNSFGQLGINTTTDSPTAVRLPLSNIKDIKISYQIQNNDVYANPTVFFLSETGGLSGCGFNGSGQLADNTTTNSLSITKINVPPVKKLYTDAHGAIYAVGTNDELSGWGNKTSYSFLPNVLSASKYSNVGPVDYLVVNDTLYKGANNGAIAVGLNKRLTAWGINPLVDKNSVVIGQNTPTEVTNVTDVSAVFVNPISANNMFINGTLVTPLTTREYTGLIKIGTNEWKTVDKHADYAIKLDNTLWSISGVPFQIGTDTDYENVFYGTPVRTTDPFDIKITTTQYFSSTDTDSVNTLSVIKPERTVFNLREYDYNAKFIGVSANTLHGTVTDYRSSTFNSQNYRINQTTSVKY
jgi:alpha-tubulin suppressor-like RCC1 family protein